jgi:hypothetical protein
MCPGADRLCPRAIDRMRAWRYRPTSHVVSVLWKTEVDLDTCNIPQSDTRNILLFGLLLCVEFGASSSERHCFSPPELFSASA